MTEPIKTRDDLRGYILRKLGACGVAVELSVEQIDDAINDALDAFNQYMCKPVPNYLTEQAGAIVIELGDEARGVLYCKTLLPDIYRGFGHMTLYEIMHRMVFPRMPIGDWYMLKSFYEMYQKTRGTNPDWYMDESTNVLYVDAWSGPYDIFYVTANDLTLEDMVHLKRAYTRDFRKYALGEAKIVLARIRGKYGGSIPVPGGTLQTDAADIRSEGEVEKGEVEAKLEQIARFTHSPVMWG